MGQMINFKRPDGADCSGHLTAPAGNDKAPGVVVIQEWRGSNLWYKAGHAFGNETGQNYNPECVGKDRDSLRQAFEVTEDASLSAIPIN